MGYNTLENYYKVLFSLVHSHKYSMPDVENMIPFERELWVDMIRNDMMRQQREMENAATDKVYAFTAKAEKYS